MHKQCLPENPKIVASHLMENAVIVPLQPEDLPGGAIPERTCPMMAPNPAIGANLRRLERTVMRTAGMRRWKSARPGPGTSSWPRSPRDDMPALLTGLQHPYRNEETREALSALPGGTCCPGR